MNCIKYLTNVEVFREEIILHLKTNFRLINTKKNEEFPVENSFNEDRVYVKSKFTLFLGIIQLSIIIRYTMSCSLITLRVLYLLFLNLVSIPTISVEKLVVGIV